MRRQVPEGIVRDVQRWSWFEQRLIRGQKYRVIRRFRDLDKDEHRPGEEWFFANSSHSHYDGILNVFVLDDDGNEWRISFHDDDSTTDDFKDLVERVPNQLREDLFATSRCIECLQPLHASRPGYCPTCHLVWDPA